MYHINGVLILLQCEVHLEQCCTDHLRYRFETGLTVHGLHVMFLKTAQQIPSDTKQTQY